MRGRWRALALLTSVACLAGLWAGMHYRRQPDHTHIPDERLSDVRGGDQSPSKNAPPTTPARCSLHQDIQGVWVPDLHAPPRAAYNCSPPGLFRRHWSCWEQDWFGNKSSPLLAPERFYDTFDTTRAPQHLACTLDPMPAALEEMQRLLFNRTIVFVGDSLAEEMWFALGCKLFGHLGGSYRRFGTDTPPLKLGKDAAEDDFLGSLSDYTCWDQEDVRFCREIQTLCWVPLPEEQFRSRMCWMQSSWDRMVSAAKATYVAVRRFGLGRRDLVMANEGMHFFSNATLKWQHNHELPWRLHDFVRAVRRLETEFGDNMPMVLWQEPSAQHFDTPTGRHADNLRSQQCVNVNVSTRAHHFTEIIADAGIPVLRIWNASASRPFEHPEWLADRLDCTHWCMPSGVLELTMQILLHHLRTFIAEREA